MAKAKLIITSHFTELVEARISAEFVALRYQVGSSGPGDLSAVTAGADAMLVTPNDHLDATFFGNIAPTAKVIATYSVGLDTSISALHVQTGSRSHTHRV